MSTLLNRVVIKKDEINTAVKNHELSISLVLITGIAYSMKLSEEIHYFWSIFDLI
jgi:hypothetical protein